MIIKVFRGFKRLKFKVNASCIPFVCYFLFMSIICTITFPQFNFSPIKQEEEQVTTELTGPLNVHSENLKNSFPVLPDSKLEGSGVNVLKFAFIKADANADGFVTIRELAKYINLKICDHIDTSVKLNPQIFAEIDKSPANGLVSWEEYHQFFLKKIGLDENYINSHDEKKHVKLDRTAKEAINRDKARWQEVLSADPYSLTLDEFLAFQHPEASTTNLLNLVDDILRSFDADGDDQLTADEFTKTYSSSADNKKLFLNDNIDERREEFKRLIDKNTDGKADRGELLQFVDPRNTRYAIQEAATLFSLSDINNDKKLTLQEMLNKTELFMTSKMISLIENFHNEF